MCDIYVRESAYLCFLYVWKIDITVWSTFIREFTGIKLRKDRQSSETNSSSYILQEKNTIQNKINTIYEMFIKKVVHEKFRELELEPPLKLLTSEEN